MRSVRGKGSGAVRVQFNRSSRLEKPYSIKKTDDDTKSLRITINNANTQDIEDEPEQTSASSQRPSIFSRLGDNPNAGKGSGTYVLFENLKSNVNSDDIKDLCESVADDVELKSISLSKYPGSPYVRAEVVFARRSQALECIKKYHNIKLDGVPMIVKLKGEDGKENPFNPIEVAPPATNASNKRLGLFGTAIDTTDDELPAPTAFGRSVRMQQTVAFREKTEKSSSRGRSNRFNQNRRPQGSSQRIKKDKAVNEMDLNDELDQYMKK